LTRDLIRARSLAAILALVVGLTLVAPPAFAAAPPVRPLAAAAAAKVQAAPAAALAQAAQASPPAGSGKPFFKTTKGVVVLVLMATAISWAAVSRSQDAVHSPARQ